jgi:hypothetical protein
MKNSLNFASFESSKKLLENEILNRMINVGDRVRHVTGMEGYVTELDPLPVVNSDEGKVFLCDPRTLTILYSFGEVWRELPEDIFIEEEYYKLSIWKADNKLICFYSSQDDNFRTLPKCSENITDALIELLLWVKEHNKERIAKEEEKEMITKTIRISGLNKKIEPLKFRVYGNDQATEKKINEIIEQQNRIIDYLNKEVNK